MIAEVLNQSLSRGELHHAYLLTGDKEGIRRELDTFLSQAVGPDYHSHPDVWWREYASLGIDDSHELRGFQTLRPVRGQRKFMLVSFALATLEAQNALLKTIEEPTPGVHIFLIIESLDRVIPTVISRCCLLKLSAGRSTSGSETAKLFAQSLPAARLKQLAATLDLEQPKEIKAAAIGLINQLESYWHEERGNIAVWREGLARLETVRTQLLWPTASVKNLLEHLAASLPVLK